MVAAGLIATASWLDASLVAIVAALLAFLGLWGLLGAWKGSDRERLLATAVSLTQAELERVDWAVGRAVRLTGRVRCVSELKEPVFGEPCCWYRITFRRRSWLSEGGDEDWYTVAAVEDQAEIILESETLRSRFRVRLDDPDISGHQEAVREGSEGVDFAALPFRLRGRVLSRVESVRAGDFVEVVGMLSKSDGAPAVHAECVRVLSLDST